MTELLCQLWLASLAIIVGLVLFSFGLALPGAVGGSILFYLVNANHE